MIGAGRTTDKGLVIVPTYNESENIAELVARLFAAVGERVDLLVVDDASPDGTASLVRGLAASYPRAHVLERAGKTGLGTAYVDGFRWAIEKGYEAVVEMDADLSHDPAIVPLLLDALGGADLAIGSRYVPGGRVENWGSFRKRLSKLGNLYASGLLRFGIRDSTSGFRAYRTSFLEAQDLGTVASQGYAFQIEMTRRAFLAGSRIVEIPITFVERSAGESKMSKRIVVEALTEVTTWGLQDRFGRKSRAAAARSPRA